MAITASPPDGRSGDRNIETTDRGSPDRPSFCLPELTAVLLPENASAWASQRLGRPVGLAGCARGRGVDYTRHSGAAQPNPESSAEAVKITRLDSGSGSACPQ